MRTVIHTAVRPGLVLPYSPVKFPARFSRLARSVILATVAVGKLRLLQKRRYLKECPLSSSQIHSLVTVTFGQASKECPISQRMIRISALRGDDAILTVN